MLNVTLGTAGHVDHGKTALVKALTGCETDRLKEEKERGMSIDLGYAPCRVADLEVGIVDVPGHENFIKTMVAGACGMDGVILVVAADDGIMPQTREHLDILTLLGLRHGLVALTKIDRVDAARRQQVRPTWPASFAARSSKARRFCRCRTSPARDSIRFSTALEASCRPSRPGRSMGSSACRWIGPFRPRASAPSWRASPSPARPRWGTKWSCCPRTSTGRIRRIEVYGQQSDTVLAGQCAAINLGHCDAREISRGDVLTLPGYFAPAEFYLCHLRLLPQEGEDPAEKRHRAEVPHRHLGGQCRALPAGVGRARAAAPRHIRPTPHQAAGGGRAGRPLHPADVLAGPHHRRRPDHRGPERRLKRNRPGVHGRLARRAAAVADAARFVEYAVRTAPALALSAADLARRTKIPHGRLDAILADLMRQQEVLAIGGSLYLHRATAAEAGESCSGNSPVPPPVAGESGHDRRAASAGVRLAEAGVGRPCGVLKSGGRRGGAQPTAGAGRPSGRPSGTRTPGARSGRIALPAAVLQPAQRRRGGREDGPAGRELDELLRILQEHQRLVLVAEGMLFHREAVERARQLIVAHIGKQGRLESVDFKYLVDTTRKFALPLLDYFDRVGLLRRVGNTRFLKAKPGQSRRRGTPMMRIDNGKWFDPFLTLLVDRW